MSKALSGQFSCSSGINKWRDQLKPSQILQNVAKVRGVSPPQINGDGSSLFFSGKHYNLQSNTVVHPHLGPARERLALDVLRNQGLVSEHVETRTLFSSHQPNLSQVKLQNTFRSCRFKYEFWKYSKYLYFFFFPLMKGRIQMWVDIFPKSLGLPGPPCDITPRKAKKYDMTQLCPNRMHWRISSM